MAERSYWRATCYGNGHAWFGEGRREKVQAWNLARRLLYCPGNNESAGKRLSGKTRKGSPWLRKLLVEAAHAASRSKNTYLAALYHRIKTRGGAKKALLAVAHAILVAIYHMLDRGVNYQEFGGNYFDEQDRQAVKKRLIRRLENLGYHVSLEAVTQIA